MLSLLSPAKKLNFDKLNRNCEASQPKFQKQASELAVIAAELSSSELSDLMKISSKLAELNRDRFSQFATTTLPEVSKQAAFAFAGDTYTGLDADRIKQENDTFFQDNIRILSGLYGVLRPFDLIQPYRLEMGSRLQNPHGSNLYEFWGNQIAKALEDELDQHENRSVINLASEEYFKVVNVKAIPLSVVTPKFLEIKNGEQKLISFYAKKARGSMARFIVNNKIIRPKDIKEFNQDGYMFNSEKSDAKTYVFSRKSK